MNNLKLNTSKQREILVLHVKINPSVEESLEVVLLGDVVVLVDPLLEVPDEVLVEDVAELGNFVFVLVLENVLLEVEEGSPEVEEPLGQVNVFGDVVSEFHAQVGVSLFLLEFQLIFFLELFVLLVVPGLDENLVRLLQILDVDDLVSEAGASQTVDDFVDLLDVEQMLLVENPDAILLQIQDVGVQEEIDDFEGDFVVLYLGSPVLLDVLFGLLL